MFNDSESAERIISASDCLECRDWCINSEYPKQHLFHFDLNIIHEWNNEQKQLIKSVTKFKKELKLISFHLSSCYMNPVIIEDMFQPNGKLYSRQEMILNAKNNIAWLKGFLNKDINIAVENTNYYPTPAYKYITEGNFIEQVVIENKINFLFDISHAMITAHNIKTDYRKYRGTLPIASTVQLHVSNFKINEDGIAVDKHDLPDESIYNEVKEIIKCNPVKYLTVEFYEETAGLLETIQKYRSVNLS